EPLPAPDPGDTRPLLAIVDSRGRVHTHAAPLAAGYWRQTIALCSQTTPARHMAYLAKAGIPALVAGQKQVDLKAALAQLAALGRNGRLHPHTLRPHITTHSATFGA
ncbi:MAG TPA: hypothetical protein P5223_13555, partial [Phycisphaerae bacterium]|nr:hypothetical protein [Phycisphaerae bacterium]